MGVCVVVGVMGAKFYSGSFKTFREVFVPTVFVRINNNSQTSNNDSNNYDSNNYDSNNYDSNNYDSKTMIRTTEREESVRTICYFRMCKQWQERGGGGLSFL